MILFILFGFLQIVRMVPDAFNHGAPKIGPHSIKELILPGLEIAILFIAGFFVLPISWSQILLTFYFLTEITIICYLNKKEKMTYYNLWFIAFLCIGKIFLVGVQIF
jgi:hypothetical protein